MLVCQHVSIWGFTICQLEKPPFTSGSIRPAEGKLNPIDGAPACQANTQLSPAQFLDPTLPPMLETPALRHIQQLQDEAQKLKILGCHATSALDPPGVAGAFGESVTPLWDATSWGGRAGRMTSGSSISSPA